MSALRRPTTLRSFDQKVSDARAELSFTREHGAALRAAARHGRRGSIRARAQALHTAR